jgi:hypothetical protein
LHDKPLAAPAKRGAYRHFMLPGDGSRKQQIRNIRASNEENESDGE